MIFTIGDKSTYEPYMARDPHAAKAAGGTVWRHREQAEACALLANVGRYAENRFKVYGVDATWDVATAPDPLENAGAHMLLRDAKLVALNPLLHEAEDISEELEEKIGAQLARVFTLRRDPEHADRWQTAVGTKTNIGVFRTAVGIIKDPDRYAQD